MCTAINLESKDGFHFFGRTMDIEYQFNQSTLLIPRNYSWTNKADYKEVQTKYAILGMGTTIEKHPLLAEAMNEAGLSIAGLNFPHYCQYEQAQEKNINAYDFILFLLSCCKDVKEAIRYIEEYSILGQTFNEFTPLPTLHWILTDKSGQCVVVELTKNGKQIHDNPIGVLTNSPGFEYHLTSLHQYCDLQDDQPQGTSWHNYTFFPDGLGSNLRGIPGDFYPNSRFVRASYLKSHATMNIDKESTVTSMFHILDNVGMIDGVANEALKQHIAIYCSCMCLETGTYYYKTYHNFQINQTSFDKHDLDRKDICIFPYFDQQTYHCY